MNHKASSELLIVRAALIVVAGCMAALALHQVKRPRPTSFVVRRHDYEGRGRVRFVL